jgi:ferredoxin-thioredoxin reductase catalytic subunit
MLKIIKNPDEKVVIEIKAALKKTNGNCPCVLPSAWNDDTKCPCKNFREQDVEGKCHCGLFIKKEVIPDA